MKFEIKPRDRFWTEKTYKVVESGNGWQLERPSKTVPTSVPDLDILLNKFFKKRKKWE